MESAEHLLAALAGEAVRWKAEEADFGRVIEQLSGAAKKIVCFAWRLYDHRPKRLCPSGCAGNCIVAAAFVTYLGPFSKVYRRKLTEQFEQACSAFSVPVSCDYDVIAHLLEDSERLQLVKQACFTALSFNICACCLCMF